MQVHIGFGGISFPVGTRRIASVDCRSFCSTAESLALETLWTSLHFHYRSLALFDPFSRYVLHTAFDQLQYLNVSIANKKKQWQVHTIFGGVNTLVARDTCKNSRTYSIVNSDNGFIGSRNTSLSKSLDITTAIFFVLF